MLDKANIGRFLFFFGLVMFVVMDIIILFHKPESPINFIIAIGFMVAGIGHDYFNNPTRR